MLSRIDLHDAEIHLIGDRVLAVVLSLVANCRPSRLLVLAIIGLVLVDADTMFASGKNRPKYLDAAYLQQTKSHASGIEITRKKTKWAVVILSNDSGRLNAGKNKLCLFFRERHDGSPIEIVDLTLDFRLLVGKLEEQPVRANLTMEQAGQYCGTIDLGQLYYEPSSYYATVHYAEAGGTKRKIAFYVSAR